eukprot:scaffold2238_cov396-Prasinococcus_capsulatus_cf.AAC.9
MVWKAPIPAARPGHWLSSQRWHHRSAYVGPGEAPRAPPASPRSPPIRPDSWPWWLPSPKYLPPTDSICGGRARMGYWAVSTVRLSKPSLGLGVPEYIDLKDATSEGTSPCATNIDQASMAKVAFCHQSNLVRSQHPHLVVGVRAELAYQKPYAGHDGADLIPFTGLGLIRQEGPTEAASEQAGFSSSSRRRRGMDELPDARVLVLAFLLRTLRRNRWDHTFLTPGPGAVGVSCSLDTGVLISPRSRC